MTDENYIEQLNELLASQAVYYQKLRNYHWNVTGPAFFQLHAKFEEMYLAAQEHVDSLAERVLALGGHPMSTMQGYLDASKISEDSENPEARIMVESLVGDIATLREQNREMKGRADEAGDDTTVNLLDDIGDAQDMDAWMLKAWLG